MEGALFFLWLLSSCCIREAQGGPQEIDIWEQQGFPRKLFGLLCFAGGNGQGKSAIAKAIFVCCGAERRGSSSPGEGLPASAAAGPEGGPRPPSQKGSSQLGSTAHLLRAAEKPRLFEYIRQYWSEGGPPKAVVSVTFSNFSSAGGPLMKGLQAAKGGGPSSVSFPLSSSSPFRSGDQMLKEEGEGLVSRVSRLTGDAFMPIDRAYNHGMYGDYITLTREITKKRNARKQQQQQQDEGEEEETLWATGSSTWFIEGQGGLGSGRREAKLNEVKALLNHFGLELTNPAVYLSQELAKTFLFRASEQSLYKFYLCASG